MLSRVGGYEGPPRSSESELDRLELLPRGSSTTQDTAQTVCIVAQVLPHLSSPCVLASYVLSTRAPSDRSSLISQPLLEMTLEPRYAPRPFRRLNRRFRYPYRLNRLSERIQTDRSILSSQTDEHPTEGMIMDDLPIILSDDRSRFPGSFTQWQADEPQIIITSDVQLQTDETTYESMARSQESETAITTPSRDGADYDASICIPPAVHNSNSLRGFQNTDSSYSHLTERGTQITPEPQVLEAIEVDPEIPAALSQISASLDVENTQAVQVMSNSQNEQIDSCEAPAAPLKVYKLNAFFVALASLPPPTPASRQLANKLIKHARNHRPLDVKALHCLNCDLLPVLPVTGSCGHTRCSNCIQTNGACPCGGEAPINLHVNTVVQHLILKIMPKDLSQRTPPNEKNPAVFNGETETASTSRSMPEMKIPGPRRPVRCNRYPPESRATFSRIRFTLSRINDRMPMSTKTRFELATKLLTVGRYQDAAPHFAHVAATCEPFARVARHTLSQIIVVLAQERNSRRIAKDVYNAVRRQSAANCFRPSDMECVLCYATYNNPVTTPCGHTYCRTCLERALDYRKLCALCSRPLDDFNLSKTRETKFVCAALESIGAYKPPMPFESDIIPILVCTVAYPAIPCPLFIFDPRYWLMIRRVLESGSRTFGMVAYESDQDYSDYGTILEVRDCVHLEDGRSLLSTVGISRFRVMERDVRDGCDVARFQTIIDICPLDDFAIIELRLMATQVLCKALCWVNRMNKQVRQEIENAFGEIPDCDEMQPWHFSPDGPAWLWWLIAILPLRSEIKVLILSTRNLLKRMTAVSRTLDVIDQAVITTTASTEYGIRSALTHSDDWLERGS